MIAPDVRAVISRLLPEGEQAVAISDERLVVLLYRDASRHRRSVDGTVIVVRSRNGESPGKAPLILGGRGHAIVKRDAV